jgi:hypothetical protein
VEEAGTRATKSALIVVLSAAAPGYPGAGGAAATGAASSAGIASPEGGAAPPAK